MLIAQISDLHLRPRGVLYQGVVDSNAMFATAVRQLNALLPQPDLVILSGDVVDEGTVAEYGEARAILANLALPFVVIPGNHDDRETFRTCFSNHGYMPATGPINFAIDDYGPLRVIGLDVTVPGQHHGLMDEVATSWLDSVLAQAPGQPTIIMMHQPPFSSSVPYLDAYRCREGNRLAEVVGRYSNVERIACGHVHRFMVVRFGGTTLCTAPSTTTAISLQLRLGAEPASYIEPPGFLLHHWSAGEGLMTHLMPIGTFPGPFPFA
jgi:Icc protein